MTGYEIGAFPDTSCIRAIAFSPDGKILASGTVNKKVQLWDVVTGNLLRTLEGHGDKVRTLAFSPDGKTLVSGSADKTIKIWRSP
ncbi:MAG: hypothetical protein MUD14_16120 [Hydrococcus sp. Prado102]|nr:hypothetical protein [Hydrococcus sp. Prado102]